MSQTVHQEVRDYIFFFHRKSVKSITMLSLSTLWGPHGTNWYHTLHPCLPWSASPHHTEISCIHCGLDTFSTYLLFSLSLLDLFYPATTAAFLYLPFSELFLILECSMSTSLLPSPTCPLLHSIPCPPLQGLYCCTRSVFFYIASLCCSFE